MELITSRSSQHVKVPAIFEMLWFAKTIGKRNNMGFMDKYFIMQIQKLRMFSISTQKIRTALPNRKRKLAHSPIHSSAVSQAHTSYQTLGEKASGHPCLRAGRQSPLRRWKTGKRPGIPGPGTFQKKTAFGLLFSSVLWGFSTPSHIIPPASPSAHLWVKGMCPRALPCDTFTPLLMSAIS